MCCPLVTMRESHATVIKPLQQLTSGSLHVCHTDTTRGCGGGDEKHQAYLSQQPTLSLQPYILSEPFNPKAQHPDPTLVE